VDKKKKKNRRHKKEKDKKQKKKKNKKKKKEFCGGVVVWVCLFEKMRGMRIGWGGNCFVGLIGTFCEEKVAPEGYGYAIVCGGQRKRFRS